MAEPPKYPKLKRFVLLPVLGTFLVLLSGYAGWAFWVQHALFEQQAARRLQSVRTAFESQFARDREKLAAALDVLQRDSGMSRMAAAGFPSSSEKQIDARLETLRRAFGIDGLQIIAPAGGEFLLKRSPAGPSETLPRASLEAARHSDGPIYRFAAGPSTNLTLQATAAWRIQEGLIGYLAVALDLGPDLKALRQTLRANTHVFLRKAELERDAWAPLLQRAAGADAWDRFTRHVMLGEAFQPLPDAFLKRMLEQPAGGGQTTRTVRGKDGSVRAVESFPFPEPGDRALGRVIASLDVTVERDAATNAGLLMGLLVFALGAGVSVLLWYVIAKAERRLAATEQSARSTVIELDRRAKKRTAELEREIGERKRTEAMLREKDYALASSISAVAIADLEGHLTYANPAFLQMWGYKAEGEVLGRATTEFWEAPHEAADVMAHLHAGGQWLGEMRARRRDGSSFVAQLSATLVTSPDGTPLSMMASFIDITQGREMERAMQESERRLLTVIQNAPVILFALDPQGNFTFSDGKGLERLGLDPGEVIGRNALHMYRENCAAVAGIECALRGEAVHLLTPVGDLTFDVRYTPVLDANGQLEEVIAIAIDVTANQEAESALRRSEEHFRALIENTLDVITVIDQEARFIFVSPSVRTQMGYEPEELLGRSSLETVHPDDQERAAQALGALLAEPGRTERAQLRIQHKDGRWEMQEFIGRNLLHVPAVGGVVLNAHNVTALLEREEQLRQAQKMEVIGQLTGGVAHDFNNLLAVILGNLELLSEKLQTEEDRTLLEQAVRAGQRGATLTQRLLAFSRKQALEPVLTDANRLVSGMTELLQRTLEETIEVETVLAAGLWPTMVDAHQLESAVMNLVVNARDAMPRGGKVTVETANVRLDDAYAEARMDVRAGQYVMVAVSDTGEGMPEAVIERAFDPFFSTKGPGKGTGLGLSMIYGFVKQSGGHVQIYSEVGHGTSVKMYLPRADVDSSVVFPGSIRPAEALARGNELVLVVEDDEDVRQLSVRFLTDLGYGALQAADGDAALRTLDREPDVTVLFTDVVLPGGMSGAQLAQQARQRHPSLKVLYTSGYTENAIIHHGRLEGRVELLQKPYRREDLARKLRAVIDEA